MTLLCLFAGAAATASAATIESRSLDRGLPKRCDVTVTFGSYCCGTDRALEQRVAAQVRRERHIRRATSTSWGREGESTLCLTTDSPIQTWRLYSLFKGWIPAVSRQSWTEVSTKYGQRYRNGWPK
jgi:hypothetical protein